MKPKFNIGQRIAYIARNKCAVGGHVIRGKWSHYVGYIKQIRKSLFGIRYVVNVAKSADVHIVPERDILHVVEKRDESNK